MERISREGLGSMAERMRAAEAEATRLRGALAQAEAKGGGSSGEAKFNGRCVPPDPLATTAADDAPCGSLALEPSAAVVDGVTCATYVTAVVDGGRRCAAVACPCAFLIILSNHPCDPGAPSARCASLSA